MFVFLKFSLFSQPYFSISEVFCCHSTIIQSEILYFVLYRFTVEHNLSFWKKNFLVQEKVKKTTAWSKKRKKKANAWASKRRLDVHNGPDCIILCTGMTCWHSGLPVCFESLIFFIFLAVCGGQIVMSVKPVCSLRCFYFLVVLNVNYGLHRHASKQGFHGCSTLISPVTLVC